MTRKHNYAISFLSGKDGNVTGNNKNNRISRHFSHTLSLFSFLVTLSTHVSINSELFTGAHGIYWCVYRNVTEQQSQRQTKRNYSNYFSEENKTMCQRVYRQRDRKYS